jgi:putative dimethyl sulfoxide reductase chaperone
MTEHDPRQAIAQEDMCRFLAACYCQPSDDFAAERLFDSIRDAATRIDPELGRLAAGLGEAFDPQDLQTLLVDYARLFLGPGEALARPYGSFWLSGDKTVMQDSTMTLLELCRESGFDLDGGFRDVPDHVAVEFELLYLLTFARNQAIEAGRIEQAEASEQREQRLLTEHLGAWIDRFTAAVRSGAQTPFYRRLAGLTERFVQLRRDRLGLVH